MHTYSRRNSLLFSGKKKKKSFSDMLKTSHGTRKRVGRKPQWESKDTAGLRAIFSDGSPAALALHTMCPSLCEFSIPARGKQKALLRATGDGRERRGIRASIGLRSERTRDGDGGSRSDKPSCFYLAILP